MTKAEKDLRQAIIDKCLWMNASGLNQGTSGNISARYKNKMLITPSGIPYDQLKPEMIASMPLEGEYGSWEGPNEAINRVALSSGHHQVTPTSEWGGSHSLNVCDHDSDHGSGNTNLPLYDCSGRGTDDSLCSVCQIRYRRAFTICFGGFGGREIAACWRIMG